MKQIARFILTSLVPVVEDAIEDLHGMYHAKKSKLYMLASVSRHDHSRIACHDFLSSKMHRAIIIRQHIS